MNSNNYQFFDIGTNLNDDMYEGLYHGKQFHKSDLADVIKRSKETGVDKMIVICGTLDECKASLKKFDTYENIFLTIGCHPTRSNLLEELSSERGYFEAVEELVRKHPRKIIAYGEIGLDYDRTHFCDKTIQKKWFNKQLEHALKLKLPFYFHMRSAAEDFIEIYDKHSKLLQSTVSSVAHCFTGTIEEANQLIERGFFIGLTGISFKTEQLCDMVKAIPLSNIVVETDCPWCEFKRSSFGYKFISTHYPALKKEKWQPNTFIKSRQEPSHVVQIVEVISHLKTIEIGVVAKTLYQNSLKLFRLR